jgi:hypothetical protein
MLRLLVLLLLLANGLFFGWTRGWFAPGWPPPRHGEREPERLAAQVQPERIAVLAPAAASAAEQAARAAAEACLEAGPFAATAAAGAEAALAAAGLPAGSWERLPEAPPSDRVWLRVPRAGSELQARLRALETGFGPCATR